MRNVERTEKKIAKLAKTQRKINRAGTEGKPARSLEIARAGLGTGYAIINLLTANITDTLEESITTSQANVVNGAVRSILKTVELQFKYGKPKGNNTADRDLVLVGSSQVKSA